MSQHVTTYTNKEGCWPVLGSFWAFEWTNHTPCLWSILAPSKVITETGAVAWHSVLHKTHFVNSSSQVGAGSLGH